MQKTHMVLITTKRKLQSPTDNHVISKGKSWTKDFSPRYYVFISYKFNYKINPHFGMPYCALLNTLKIYKFMTSDCDSHVSFLIYSLWKAFALSLKDYPGLGLTNGRVLGNRRQE